MASRRPIPTKDITDLHCTAKALLSNRNTQTSNVYLYPHRRYRKRHILTACCRATGKTAVKEGAPEGVGQAASPPDKPSIIVAITPSRYTPTPAPKSTRSTDSGSSRKTASTPAETGRVMSPSTFRRTATSADLRRDAVGLYATPTAVA